MLRPHSGEARLRLASGRAKYNRDIKKVSRSEERLTFEWRGPDLNRRPRGYEPRELPGCSTPRQGVPWLGGREYIV